MKILNVDPNALVPAGYNPALRITDKNLKTLKNSIEKDGLIYPILIDNKKNIIDGHRRVKIAILLGLTAIPAIVNEKEISKEDLYEIVNFTQRRISSNEMIYIYINGGKVPDSVLSRIKQIENIIGLTGLKMLARKSVSAHIIKQARTIGYYCGDLSDAFTKKTIFWLVKHRTTHIIRIAMNQEMSYIKIKSAIKSNKPLKRVITTS